MVNLKGCNIMINTEKTNTIVLYKSTTWYNPLYVHIKNTGYKLNNILFYDENGVVYQTGHGWFNSEFSTTSFDIRLSTSKQIKRKIKMDFSKNEPFIFKCDDSYDISYNLYLPVSDFNIEYKYKKQGDSIFKIFYLIDDNNNKLYGQENVKYLGSIPFNARIKLQEIGKKFSDYSYTPMSEKEFNNNINDLKQAYKDHIDALEYVKNYTVEDYLKELEEQKNKEE
jgi:hypothetical protein